MAMKTGGKKTTMQAGTSKGGGSGAKTVGGAKSTSAPAPSSKGSNFPKGGGNRF